MYPRMSFTSINIFRIVSHFIAKLDSLANSREYFALGDYCMALERNGLMTPSHHYRRNVNNAFPLEDLGRLVLVSFGRVEILGLRYYLSTIRTGDNYAVASIEEGKCCVILQFYFFFYCLLSFVLTNHLIQSQ